MSLQLKAIILILLLKILYIYLKIETKTELLHRLHQSVKQRIKDRINERMTEGIKHFKNKNKTLNKHSNYSYNNYTGELNNLTNYILHNHHHTNFKTYPEYFIYDINIKELEEFKNSTDYEAM